MKTIYIGDVLKILELNMEICGYVEDDITIKYKRPNKKRPKIAIETHNLELVGQNPGDRFTYDKRGSCKIDKSYFLDWHTHPIGLAPWPSVEDVFNLIMKTPQNHPGRGSLIFTHWGIWEIYSGGYIRLTQTDFNNFKKISSMVWRDIRTKYYINNNNKETEVYYIDMEERDAGKYIQGLLNSYNNYLVNNFEMTFTPWSYVENNKYSLRTKLKDYPYDFF